MPFGLPFLGSMARRAIPLTAVAAAPLILLIGTLAVLHAQSSPSISIVLAPHNSVPQNTAITGTVTLSNLDPTDYSSLVFRADTTKYGTPITDEHSDCLGEDTNTDITVDVDAGSEEFELRVHKSCAAHIFGHYELDLTLFKLDSMAPGGRVELATESTRFAMNRYLTIGEPTATPPAPDTRAWLDPDPTTFDIYVGEWHFFQNRANILLYLNDHLGVKGFGDEDYQLVAPGEGRPSRTVEEACGNQPGTIVHWRRAINQGLWIAACKPGDATITLRHETDAVEFLTTNYDFQALARSGNSAPQFESGTDARTVPENTPSGVHIGAPVTATDADNDTLTYTLGGRDGSSFAIVSSSGQLQTRNALNHETKSSYVVTVSVRDNKNVDGDNDTAVDDTITVTITVENLDELGTVTVSPAQPYVGRTSTARLNDPDDAVANVAWRWEISSDGSAGWADISGAASATYTPVSADLTRYLRASVTYDDGQGTGKSGQTAATPAVREAPVATPTPEPAPRPAVRPRSSGGGGGSGGGGSSSRSNRAPEFEDGESVQRLIAENTPAGQIIGDPLEATDREDDTLTYGLEGDDADSFDIDAATGELLTKVPFDYEKQAGYTVVVSVSDGKDSRDRDDDDRDEDDFIDVDIFVTNMDEPGIVLLSSYQPPVGRAITAQLTDPDSRASDVAWKWERSSDEIAWTAIDMADSADYTSTDDDVDHYLRATATYTDRFGPSKTAQSATGDPVMPNTIPRFPTDDVVARTVAEHAGSGIRAADADNVGEPVTASDPDGDALIYSLSGDDAASFVIDQDSGQITVAAGVVLDIETRNSYSFTCSVTDGKDANGNDDAAIDDTITIAIAITNIDEAGTVALSHPQPVVGVAITAVLSHPSSDVSTVGWVWERSTDQIDWTAISGNVTAGYTPVTADVGYFLRARASYSDAHGPNRAAQAASSAKVVESSTDGVTPVTVAPIVVPIVTPTAVASSTGLAFLGTIDGVLIRTVPENTVAGGVVGAPVKVDTSGREAWTYSLGGPDAASFSIELATGQIRTTSLTAVDYEAIKYIYSVDVTATNFFGASATVAVTIQVTDVNLPSPAGRYDVNNNEAIERDELIVAISDYFAGLLTREEALVLVRLYFGA